jgi:hypothetical protein
MDIVMNSLLKEKKGFCVTDPIGKYPTIIMREMTSEQISRLARILMSLQKALSSAGSRLRYRSPEWAMPALTRECIGASGTSRFERATR